MASSGTDAKSDASLGVPLDEVFADVENDPEFKRGYAEADLEVRLAMELSKARRRACMTQAQLAKAIGSKQSVVSRIESAGQNVTLGTLSRIAEALGADLVVTLRPR